MDGLRTYGIDAFARSLHHELTEGDSKYAFFLGAGCSVTSGIPAAAELVRRHWLPKLVKLRTGDEKRADDWAKRNIKDFDPHNPAASYSKVMEERFDSAQKRQEEIQRITSDGKPGYGYSALARLLAHQDYGRRCNVVLTTNFDDLVADALYLFGGERGRPLVIGHEALMSFVRVTRTAPMVVKLHHDRHLAPKNTEAEIDQLAEHVRHALHNVLQERGLIFMGYGGADPSIVKALKELKGGLPYGVYWINDGEPQADLRAWLIERNAIWVKHRDFDQAMFMIAKEFGLDQPQRPRSVYEIFCNNKKKYKQLLREVISNPDPEQAPLRQAAQEAASKVSIAFAMLLTAVLLEKADPDAAEKVYLDGITQHPTNADLIWMYARFLHFIRKDYDRTETFYQRAIDAAPRHAYPLGYYAGFLFGRGRDGEGLGMLERCEAENPGPALLLECRFYRLCRAATTDAERAELLRLSKQAIIDGVRSPRYDLSANVERARSDNVPGVDMLAVLAKVIADKEPAETLNHFPEWVAAG